MIRFGLRLSLAGGREALVRLLTIAAAVAVGVGLLLASVAGLHAVTAQGDRYAWLNTAVLPSSTEPDGVAPTWWDLREDYFAGVPMAQVDVAATGPGSPVPPGIPALPGPGEYFASPQLARLIADHPAAQLANRYPGRPAGIIADQALQSPSSLIAVVGRSEAEMAADPNAVKVTRISNVLPRDCKGCAVGLRASGFELVLGVVIAALLFPVLIFIGAATRLTAARREERFAAMRLVGATPRQVSTIASAEMSAAAVTGTAVGFALFYALRAQFAAIPFTGQPFFVSDVVLGPIAVVAVALGIPVAAAVAARLALRRVKISPLGVSRRTTPRPPRAWRLAVAPTGLAFLGFFVVHGVPEGSVRQVEVFLPGILTVMIGLILAGPWLTMVAARTLARRSRHPAALIAARRLADNPGAAFRAISGLVVGLFVTTISVGVLTTLNAQRGSDLPGVARTLMVERLDRASMTSVPASVVDDLSSTTGVRAVLVLRENPEDATGRFLTGDYDGLTTCAELARHPELGSCTPGATTANVDVFFDPRNDGRTAPVWPTTGVAAEKLATMPITAIVADTDGSRATLESVRTILDSAFPTVAFSPGTQDDWAADFTRTSVGFRRLAYVVSLASLPIAGCSLAVSVIGGLSERKRPFSLLRLTGVSLRTLRRVVAFESAVPLLLVAVVAIGLGLVAAQLFLKAQMHYTLSPPGLSYYAIVVIGLAASLAIIGSTLPLLSRITGPEVARND
ncbi:MAG TPA: ABC transporter permease [Actinoplanes sp.]